MKTDCKSREKKVCNFERLTMINIQSRKTQNVDTFKRAFFSETFFAPRDAH